MPLESLDKFAVYRYRYVFGHALLIILAAILIWSQLGRLLPGLHQYEADHMLRSMQPLKGLLDNPVAWPYYALERLALAWGGGTAFVARFVAALVGTVVLALFYLLLHYWYRPRVAVTGTILLITSSWFLHTFRLATPAVLIPLATLGLLLSYTWFGHTKYRRLAAITAGVVTAVSLYIPLMAYALVAVLFFNWRSLKKLALTKKGRPTLIMAALVMVIALVPLLLGIYEHPHVARELLGLPAELPSIGALLSQFQTAFAFIFWRSYPDSATHLGVLPLLDIFTATMTALGLYHYERHLDQPHTRMLIGAYLGLFVGVALADNPQLYPALLVPTYIVATKGLMTLLQQWYSIFPRNPLARTAAVIPLSILLFTGALYHTQRYFVAWARTPQVRLEFGPESTALREAIASYPPGSKLLIITEDGNERLLRAALIGTAGYTSVVADDQGLPPAAEFTNVYVDERSVLPADYQAALGQTKSLVVTERSSHAIAFRVYKPIVR